jgi:hypothetical protein
MRLEPRTIRVILNAQMGKAGPPMDGKDIHVEDISWGIFPPTAPLGINPVNIAGVAMAFAREGAERVAVSLIGEGGASLGEWHEAINACAVRKLPAIFASRTARRHCRRRCPTSKPSACSPTGRPATAARHHSRRNRSGDCGGTTWAAIAGAQEKVNAD